MAQSREDIERALNSWLRVTSAVAQLQQFHDLCYNEAVICNLLMRNSIENPDEPLTATDLCRQSNIAKSQMNRTLQSLEERGIIKRHRSKEDRRRVYTELRPDSDVYEREHLQVLSAVQAIVDEVGAENLNDIVATFDAISDAAERISSREELAPLAVAS